MSDKTKIIGSYSFKISGEFVTKQIREWWAQGEYTRAINLLKEELTQNQIKAIIEGEYKLDGINTVTMVADNWDGFNEYGSRYASWHDVLSTTKELQNKEGIDDSFLQLVLPQKDNKMKSKCGWLLPNGDYYGCEYTGHWKLADDLLFAGKEDDNLPDPELKAESLGWIKISGAYAFRFTAFKKPTQKQLDKLFDYCEIFKLDYQAEMKKFDHLSSIVPEVFH